MIDTRFEELEQQLIYYRDCNRRHYDELKSRIDRFFAAHDADADARADSAIKAVQAVFEQRSEAAVLRLDGAQQLARTQHEEIEARIDARLAELREAYDEAIWLLGGRWREEVELAEAEREARPRRKHLRNVGTGMLTILAFLAGLALALGVHHDHAAAGTRRLAPAVHSAAKEAAAAASADRWPPRDVALLAGRGPSVTWHPHDIGV